MQLYDSRGNEIQFLDRVGGDSVIDTRPATVLLGAINAEVAIDLAGEHTASVNVAGTFTATLQAECSIDGVTYFAVPIYNINTEIYTASITAIGQYIYDIPAGCRKTRIRAVTWTSSPTVALRASKAQEFVIAKKIPATVQNTTTAATGVAVSHTISGLPGVYIYLVSMYITKFCTATLTASAAPVIVTTGNLFGNPSFNFGAGADLIGTKESLSIEPSTPVKSLASATAIVVTCPATPNVIWKVTTFSYVGA
jgi:hypothetical protein